MHFVMLISRALPCPKADRDCGSIFASMTRTHRAYEEAMAWDGPITDQKEICRQSALQKLVRLVGLPLLVVTSISFPGHRFHHDLHRNKKKSSSFTIHQPSWQCLVQSSTLSSRPIHHTALGIFLASRDCQISDKFLERIAVGRCTFGTRANPCHCAS